MKNIFLVNWVTISRKQLYQLKKINELNYSVTVFTNDLFGESEYWINQAGPNSKYIKQHIKLISRLQNLLRETRNLKSIKCVILAPEGRYSIFALILLKIMKIKIVCIEWGTIARINSMNIILKKIIKFCYKYSDLIWYKEPYMKPLLSNITSRNLYFLPNAVEVTNSISNTFNRRNITFIWANRLVHGRRPDWYITAANKIYNESGQYSILMGFLNDMVDEKMQDRCKKLAEDGITLLNFGDSYQQFPKSRFFVLAAEQVFGNNSLLEAMSHGAVPIVTNSIGINEIIDNGENGIIAENSEIGLYQAMKMASCIDEFTWNRLSQNAIETVKNKFSVNKWGEEFEKMMTIIERDLND